MKYRRKKLKRACHPLIGRKQSVLLCSLLEVLNHDLGSRFGKDVLDPAKGLFPEVDPLKYSSSGSFADDYMLSEVLSKYPFKIPGVDREAVALAKFKDSEQQCSLANETVGVNTWLSSYHDSGRSVSWHAVIETARLKVLHLLGSFSWNQVEVHCNFGPGASTSLLRNRSDAFYKFGSKPDVTEDCMLLGWAAVYRQPAWFESLTGSRPQGHWVDDFARFPPEQIFNLVPGSRITTVPKNAKTNRVIAIEPDLNMYLQKGIGAAIRRRLRRAGIDLNDQTHNQRLAREGSLTGELATIDFSSASDTICKELVELLIPPDWLVALKQVRSPVGDLPDGSRVAFSKFSSMGNGFTFELESMIFYAIASAVLDLCGVKGVVSVYGDDLIAPSSQESERALKWAFGRAGFTINDRKSHFHGPFRESCGKHYFRGDDVTPFYIRHEINNVWDVYAVANKMRRWARMSWGLDPRIKRAYESIVDAIPSDLRYRIPEGYGDVGLVVDFDEALPSFDRHLQQLRVKALRPLVRYELVQGLSLISKYFHQCSSTDREGDLEALPRTVVDYGVEWRPLVRQWPSFGPWFDDRYLSEVGAPSWGPGYGATTSEDR